MKEMSDRKPSRSRKTISYAGLDDESDDDFATGPASKKQKSSKHEDKVKKERKNHDSNTSMSPTTTVPTSIRKRQSNYDDELQRALELSMLEKSSSQDTNDSDSGTKETSRQPQHNGSCVKNVKVDIEPIPSAPRLDRVEISNLADLPACEDSSAEPPKLMPVGLSVCGTIIDETIEVEESETDERKVKRREVTRRQRAPKKCVVEEDSHSEGESDFNPNDESASGDDDDGEEEENFSPSDDDSDFNDGKNKSKKTAKVTKTKKSFDSVVKKSVSKPKKPTTNTRRSQKTSLTETSESESSILRQVPHPKVASPLKAVAPKPSLSAASTTHSSPAAASPQTSTKSSPLTSQRSSISVSPGLVSRQWKPPGQSASNSPASESVIKSPSSGLRLGLSRNQRVKPLHSSVNVV